MNQDDLNSQKRRKISRGLKRLIDREKNGMARLIRELKKGIKDEVDDSKRSANASSESDEKFRDGEEDGTTYHRRIPLVLSCPKTITTHAFHQVSPALDESSRTVFALSHV